MQVLYPHVTQVTSSSVPTELLFPVLASFNASLTQGTAVRKESQLRKCLHKIQL